jgi:hypothetical protein
VATPAHATRGEDKVLRRRVGLDSSKRSMCFWTCSCASIVACAVLVELATELLERPWMHVKPSASVLGGWLPGSPLEALGPWVSHLGIYVPDIGLMLIAGGVLGKVLPNSWRSCVTLLAISFVGACAVRGGGPWSHWFHALYRGRSDLMWGYSFLSVVVLGSPVVGAWIAVRLFSEALVDPSVCARCGYLLRGLSSCRCPECGTKFDMTETSSSL